MVSQIQPPLDSSETTKMFIHTLKAPYYDMMVGHAAKDFSKIVMSGALIDNAIKTRRLEFKPSNFEGPSTQKEEEENDLFSREGRNNGEAPA